MNKMLAFAGRNRKEILRDPINVFFGIGLPLLLLILFGSIQKKLPVEVFGIARFAPGMAVFSLSFISLFSGVLLAKDRSTSFLMRLCAAPMRPTDYIAAYALPFLPLAVLQTAICLAVSLLFGMPFSAKLLLSIIVMLPAALLYIGIGLLLGSMLNDKQVGGICGGVVINVSALLSGAWFDFSMFGGTTEKIAYLLPFAHSVDAARAAIAGNYGEMGVHVIWIFGYAALVFGLAVFAFSRSMRKA